MFCPEDGTEIPVSLVSQPNIWYHPCPNCGTCWYYDGEQGSYQVDRNVVSAQVLLKGDSK